MRNQQLSRALNKSHIADLPNPWRKLAFSRTHSLWSAGDHSRIEDRAREIEQPGKERLDNTQKAQLTLCAKGAACSRGSSSSLLINVCRYSDTIDSFGTDWMKKQKGRAALCRGSAAQRPACWPYLVAIIILASFLAAVDGGESGLGQWRSGENAAVSSSFDVSVLSVERAVKVVDGGQPLAPFNDEGRLRWASFA